MSTIPGVAQANLYGAPLYAMRIWLDADAMAARGVTVDDVENALNAQNVELPAGALEGATKDFTIRVSRSLFQARGLPEAAPARRPTPDGFVVRLGDVARVEEGPDERRKLFRGNGVQPGRHRPDPPVAGQRRRDLQGVARKSRKSTRRCRPAPR
jgi:multidrug efflux pump